MLHWPRVSFWSNMTPGSERQVASYLVFLHAVKEKKKKKTPVTKTRASDRPPPCSLSQRCKQQHNANKAHRHNGDRAQPPARRRTEKHVKAHNGLFVLQSIWNTAMFRCGQKAIKKKN